MSYYSHIILVLVTLVAFCVNYHVILDGDLPKMTNYADIHSDPSGAFANPVNSDDELYSELLDFASKNWGVKGSNIETLMEQIGQHESRGDHAAIQRSQGYKDDGTPYIFDGPGRGYYQFETAKGSNAGNVAMSRLQNLIGDGAHVKDEKGTSVGKKGRLFKSGREMPSWMTSGESVDASKLNKKQQDILFLANYLQHPTARIDKDVLSSNEGRANFWADMHWAGDEKDKAGKIKKFYKSQGWEMPGQVSYNRSATGPSY
jgi:hypothetical protein